MIFLKELKDNEKSTDSYYKIRKDGSVELQCRSQKGKEYNITNLIIDPIELLIDNQILYKCKVSWFNDQTISPAGDTKYNKENPANIIIQFNLEKLVTDKKYFMFFMEELLDKKRVLKYLQYGMQENPVIECGNYIGYIDYDEKGYPTKYFDKDIAKQCHHLAEKEAERNQRTNKSMRH